MKKKTLIQIPCFNEEKTLPITINEIRNEVKLFDYQILIIDDGSTDNTLKIAKDLNVDYIIQNKRNIGLGRSFQKGIDFAKKNKFDFLINTDADNQYKAQYLDKLYEKIISSNSDIIIGSRNFEKINNFSKIKIFLQKFGSLVVSFACGQKINDAVSGFRIYNKDAIEKIFVTSKFSYTIDVLIQSFDHNLLISDIPIEVNTATRPSRLFKGIFNFVLRQTLVIASTFIIYRPLQFFSLVGLIPLLLSISIFIRFFILYFIFDSEGHIQSLIAGTLLFMLSIIIFSIGIIGTLIKDLRKRK
jgi:glycosyltransferase involved in cell wall biosynthesis